MSTIIIAAILIILTIVPIVAFILIHKKNEKKRNQTFFNSFGQAGAKYGLSFSSQEVLRNKIIGFDGLKQALLIFEFENINNAIYIHMAEVKSYTIKKEYDRANIGNEKNTKPEQHLRSIYLKIVFNNSPEPVSVSFYDSGINSIYEMAELEAKAKKWENLLSMMLAKELGARA